MATLGSLTLFLAGCFAKNPIVSLPLSPLVSLAGQAVAPAPSPLGGASPAGVLDPTLWGYVTAGQLWQSRGAWYNIIDWAASTSHCSTNASSVACMACSMERPAFAVSNGVAPIGALLLPCLTRLLCQPLPLAPSLINIESCVQVYMPNGTASPPGCPDLQNAEQYPDCLGGGTEPYLTGVSDPLNYGAEVHFDPAKQLPYFYAIIVEWFDRNQTTNDYALSYPSQYNALAVEKFGTWPIIYEGTPCPTGNSTLQYQFLNTSAALPGPSSQGGSPAWLDSGTSLGLPAGGAASCDNLAGKPCSSPSVQYANPLDFIKLQITGQRIPISSVEIYLSDKQWHVCNRTGDGYWAPVAATPTPDASEPVDIRIYCADGSPPKTERGLVPATMLCPYQTPGCKMYTGTVQC